MKLTVSGERGNEKRVRKRAEDKHAGEMGKKRRSRERESMGKGRH